MDYGSDIPDKSRYNDTACPINYILAKNKTLCYMLVGGYKYGEFHTFLALKDEAIKVCNLLSNGTIPHRKWFQLKFVHLRSSESELKLYRFWKFDVHQQLGLILRLSL